MVRSQRKARLSLALLVSCPVFSGVGCSEGPGAVSSSNTDPTLLIYSPQDGASLAPAEPVVVLGHAEDREDKPTSLSVTVVLGNNEPITVTPDANGDWRYDLGVLDAGTYSLQATARDTRSGVGQLVYSFSVEKANEKPAANISRPVTGDSFDERTYVALEGLVSDDGALADLTVEWSSSLQGVLGSSTPDIQGNVQLLTNALVPGQHTLRLIVSDGEYTSSDEVAVVINDVNRPPDTPVVTLGPTSPRTDDDLEANLSNPQADPDGDTLSYAWTWTRNGDVVADLRNKQVVPASYTTRGELWRVSVAATDPSGVSSEAGSAELTVLNSAPTLDTAALSPLQADVATTFTVIAGTSGDADSDPVELRYEWLVNGSVVVGQSTSRLPPGHFARGDEVRARVTPHDGIEAGQPVLTDPVTVGDALATGLAVDVTPNSPTLADDLACDVVSQATDADGDSISYTWAWSRNGQAYPAGDDRQTLSAGETALGDLWRCTVTPRSNGQAGTPASDQVSISSGEGSVIVTEVMVSPDSSSTDGEYVELRNTTDTTIDLSGWVLRDDAGDHYTISATAPLPLVGGGYLVVGASADLDLNGGVDVDEVWSGFRLDDGGDEVVLEADGDVVDRMAWGPGVGLAVTTGAALNLDPDAFDALANDLPEQWCRATTPMSAHTFGTPGEANDACACADSDIDGDGYGSDEGACSALDCDDEEFQVSPGEEEICEDDIDNNCDGGDALCDCEGSDDDGDGYGDVRGCPELEMDCDDTSAGSYPGAAELCDGKDNDCDGVSDDGLDKDGDGARVCPAEGEDEDCDDRDPEAFPGNTEGCDNKDNDCDAQIDEGFDVDNDSYTTCEGDCNDNQPAINPGAAEVCEDGIDNNCGGGDATCACATTDSDGDGFGEGSSCPANQRDCNDQDPQTYPGAPERCDNVDNDCDGTADDGLDVDGDGVESCGSPADCDDTDATIKPGATETCDGIDQNCDGVVDEGFDQDQDGYNVCGSSTGGASDCNDSNPLVNPDAVEKCDRVDNNCNGLVDEGRPDEYEPNDYENYAYDLGYVGVAGSETWNLELTINSPTDKDYFSFVTTDAGGRLNATLILETSDLAVEAELCAGTIDICLEVEAPPYSSDEMYKPSLPMLPEGGEWLLRVEAINPGGYSCEPFTVTIRMQ